MPQSPFEGRLVRLRAAEPEDAPAMHRWMNDPEVIDNLAARYPTSVATHLERTRHVELGFAGAPFVIEAMAESRPIGWVALRRATPEDRCAALGIAIGEKDFWDGGYGTDAMRTVCRFGFDEMNLRRIELDVFPANKRAIRVYEKVGFRVECNLRQAMFKSGEYRDLILMGLLKGELQ
jgi:RimJ/RimL family protein N-acetyltransferase